MKLDELINKLEQVKEEHGNLEVTCDGYRKPHVGRPVNGELSL